MVVQGTTCCSGEDNRDVTAAGFRWSEPAVRLDPVSAPKHARELARARFALPEGRPRSEFLWSDVAPRVSWSADASGAVRSDLSVGEMLTAAQQLESVIANAPDRQGPGSSQDVLATVLEFLLTAERNAPVLAALGAVNGANEALRRAGRPRLRAQRRLARALDSSAPTIRAAHARLREAIADDPVLGR